VSASHQGPVNGALILTAGHSTHSREAFEDLLHANAVRALADVRAHPGSRRMPHFNREALERSLATGGIAYAHLPELGGRRRPAPASGNVGWEVAAFRGYADHMASTEFARGLDRLEALARERRTAIMCAEALWWRCHRRLVADSLTVRGWHVVHIAADGSTTPHALTEFAVVEGGRVSYPPAQSELQPS
jgi:uncharacterized protein (DUF488 family)